MPPPDSPLPDWQRAHGKPLFDARIKEEPDDFEVVETLGFDPSGDGEHDYLWVEKRGANTAWVARQLARHAGVPNRDIGYSGLKDRQAVTRQWFSVRRPSAAGTNWNRLDVPGVRVLDIARNRRKLKRGSHDGNAFRIVVCGARAAPGILEERLRMIRELGVPNYFGPQRFGRQGANLALAASLASGRRLGREKRGFAVSAARSFLFNEVLSARVADGSWNRILPGDAANLDGTGSHFLVDSADREIDSRVARFDLHPTGPLWGDGDLASGGAVQAAERRVARLHAGMARGLESLRVGMDRRPLRLKVADLDWQLSGDKLLLSFALRRGSYATAVLREIAGD
jgi:tRNA pseudouridine13 synthase